MTNAGPRQSIPSGTSDSTGTDAAQILNSIGEAAYDWHIDSDVLLWSTNAAAVLLIADIVAIATGHAYAQVIEAENAQVRFDAVMQSDKRDDGRDEIVAALNERRIFLAYETIVRAADRRPAFYECLMRIRRTDGSLIAAGDIVPIAERLGLMRLLDHRVLELVVDEMIASPSLQASFNVSAASTTDPDWWAGLGSLLRTHAEVAERLTVEITESAAIHDIDETRGFVARVKELGCRIAIDDFGAGYTSFRNLRKLGVDIVKIDGAFVHDMMRSEDDRAFVRTLIDLAKRLKLMTVAEWVPDEVAAKMLHDWGCDYLQGAVIGLASTERPWLAGAAKAV